MRRAWVTLGCQSLDDKQRLANGALRNEPAESTRGRHEQFAARSFAHVRHAVAGQSVIRAVVHKDSAVESAHPHGRAEPQKASRVLHDAPDLVAGQPVSRRVGPQRQALSLNGQNPSHACKNRKRQPKPNLFRVHRRWFSLNSACADSNILPKPVPILCMDLHCLDGIQSYSARAAKHRCGSPRCSRMVPGE